MKYITDKAWTRINIMPKLKFKLDRKSLGTIYVAFIRPLLEYADVIGDNCTNYEKLNSRISKMKLQESQLELPN